MKEKILSDLYRSKDLEDLIQKMNPAHLRDDLKQELFVILCSKSESIITSLYQKSQLRYYVTRVVLNMIQSSSSPFHKMYRQYLKELREYSVGMDGAGHTHTNSTDLNSDLYKGNFEKFIMKNRSSLCADLSDADEKEYQHSALVDAVNTCMDSLPFYNRELFLQYVEAGSAEKLRKVMFEATAGTHAVPKRSILQTVKDTREKIKKETYQYYCID